MKNESAVQFETESRIHMGLAVKDMERSVAFYRTLFDQGPVREVATRLSEAGLDTAAEENVTCCYAVQIKVWATDPDGNKWEVYVVLDNDAARHVPVD